MRAHPFHFATASAVWLSGLFIGWLMPAENEGIHTLSVLAAFAWFIGLLAFGIHLRGENEQTKYLFAFAGLAWLLGLLIFGYGLHGGGCDCMVGVAYGGFALIIPGGLLAAAGVVSVWSGHRRRRSSLPGLFDDVVVPVASMTAGVAAAVGVLFLMLLIVGDNSYPNRCFCT